MFISRTITAALLGLTVPVHAGLRAAQSDGDTAYVLVQYSGIACQPSQRHVCQHLTKGACTQTSANEAGVTFQVHAQLDENADGSFSVLGCPEDCTCQHKTAYTANKCESGTYGTTSLSYMLIPGEEYEGCLTYDFDVVGGRHAAQYEIAMANTTSEERFQADEEEEAAQGGKSMLAHTTTVQARSAAGFFRQWSSGVEEPDYNAQLPGGTVHVDGESTTGDWGEEYGYKKKSFAAAAGLLGLLLAQ